MYPQGKLRLKTLLGEYPKTIAIREGKLQSELVDLEVDEIKEATKGFKRLVRNSEFDFGELAIMTFLIARDWGKPYVLLPFVMNGTFHHGSVYYDATRGALTPKDLEGRKLALRSYSQTTPTWVRGVLADQFGVDLDKVTWVTFEESHVAEFKEPSNVVRAREGATVAGLLGDGEVDAANLGSGPQADERFRQLIPDAKAAARAWYDKHKAVPINHMAVVRKELLADRPDVVRELFRLLMASREMSGGAKVQDGIDLQPVGVENIRNSLALACDYAYRQGLIRTPVTVDELFDEVTASLGEGVMVG